MPLINTMPSVLLYILLCSFSSNDAKTKDFFNEVQKYDLSHILTCDSIIADTGPRKIKRPESIGYIGDNYYRFFIHFSSVIKDRDNKHRYFVHGKTKTRNIICSFQGSLLINEAQLFEESDVPGYTQGFVKGKYNLYQNRKQKHSGKLIGSFSINFFIDKHDQIQYDALMLVADGFENNQFEGIWQSYDSTLIKKCNWGDFRIPDSRELDSGASDFHVDDKYLKNGWEDYNKESEKRNTDWWK